MERRIKTALGYAGFVLLCIVIIWWWAAGLQDRLADNCWSQYSTEQEAIANCEVKE